MKTPETIWGLVLAGGKSRRMGRDKALLERNGQSQLDHAVNLLQRHVDKVFVSTRPDQSADPERAKFAQIRDRYENLGPIAGILSAMDAHHEVSWLVIACDLPNLDDQTVEYLLQNAAAEEPVSAYQSATDGLPEPLCAIYRPAARPIIDTFVANGLICPRKMLIKSNIHLLRQPNPVALHNVNTPDDLAGAEAGFAS